MHPFIHEKISNKLKHARQYFSITQYNFSKMGINQNYISMIESEKRSPSPEMTECIYNALLKITDGAITTLYTKKQFCMTLNDQAEEWLNTYFGDIEILICNYQYCINQLKKYELYNQIYKIYEQIADHYSSISNHKMAQQFYLNCVEYAIRINMSPHHTYFKIGKTMQYQSEYKQALIYYYSAYDYIDDTDEEKYYQLQLLIAEMYYKCNELDDSMLWIEKILTSCQITKISISAKLIEGLIFYEHKNYKKATQCFQKVIFQKKYKSYHGYAYYGISLCLTS